MVLEDKAKTPLGIALDNLYGFQYSSCKEPEEFWVRLSDAQQEIEKQKQWDKNTLESACACYKVKVGGLKKQLSEQDKVLENLMEQVEKAIPELEKMKRVREHLQKCPNIKMKSCLAYCELISWKKELIEVLNPEKEEEKK